MFLQSDIALLVVGVNQDTIWLNIFSNVSTCRRIERLILALDYKLTVSLIIESLVWWPFDLPTCVATNQIAYVNIMSSVCNNNVDRQ